MPISPYLRELRARIGTTCLLLPGVAGLLRDEAGRVLLVRRSDDGLWSLPAGGVDPGESPAQSMVREFWEETGLRVLPERIAGVFGGPRYRYTYPNGDQVEPMITVFAVRRLSGRPRPVDGETREVRYFPTSEIPPLVQPYPDQFFEGLDRGGEAYFEWDAAWLEAEPPSYAAESQARPT